MKGLMTVIVVAAFGLAATPAGAAPLSDGGVRATAAAKKCKKACHKRRARKRLSDRVLIRFTETGTLGSSLDERLHLCRNGDYIYDTVSYLPETGTTYSERYTGRWKVLGARVKGRRGRATVRGTDSQSGVRTKGKFSWDPSAMHWQGGAVIEERSDLC